MRVNTIQYMLAVNALENEQAIVSGDEACQLQIECSVMVDGVSGCLVEMLKPEAPASPTAAEITMASEEFGPVISSKLRRLA